MKGDRQPEIMIAFLSASVTAFDFDGFCLQLVTETALSNFAVCAAVGSVGGVLQTEDVEPDLFLGGIRDFDGLWQWLGGGCPDQEPRMALCST